MRIEKTSHQILETPKNEQPQLLHFKALKNHEVNPERSPPDSDDPEAANTN